MNKYELRKIEVLELFHEGKKSIEELCEDLYVANDSFVAVIDGASSSIDFKINDKMPGRFASEVIKSALSDCPEDLYIDQLIEHINIAFQSIYKDLNYDEVFKKEPAKMPKAVMAVYSKYYNEIWIIGDCQAMVDGEHFQHEKIIDSITANTRALYLEAELQRGKTIGELMQNDTGWTYIRPLIQMQNEFQNADPKNPYSYEVVNGFPIHISQIQKVEITNEPHEIVLATDGYPILKSTLKETEAELARILEEDPLCFRKYPSTKGLTDGNLSFDDRTYIKFKI